MDFDTWKEFCLGDWFEIKKGKRLTAEDQAPGSNLYIGAVDSNNGVTNHIAQDPQHEGNTITVNYNGSVGESFYQPDPFWATDDVNVLYLKPRAKYNMNVYIGLFIATVIRHEKYRFSYGRKWTLKNMKKSIIRLPADSDGNPNWVYMENYMRGLYSDTVENIDTIFANVF